METTFLVIVTLLFLFFQTYGASRSNTTITTSSNVTCIERERQSLLVFRQGLTDESSRLSAWTGVECCAWQGVGCDRRNGHVVKLDLRSPLSFFTHDYTISINTSMWLKGKVSRSLLNLKHLSYLDLSMNNFSGQNIPEFLGCFKYLEYLNLSNSGFSGVVPPHLGNLSRLQYLDLSLLQRYDIPYEVSLMVKDDMRWVSLMSSLKHLDLSGIKIGNHTDWFRPVNMLPSLRTLNLARCDINYIPSIKFINFTSLKSLDLSGNHINSIIPVWLSNLTGLMHLNLAANSFHGPVPADVKLCNLSVLDLSNNEFAEELSTFIGNVSSDCLHNSLKELNLEENQFNGRIPNRIGEFKKLESLAISWNALSGPIPPSLGQLSNLQYLDLSSNQLSGSIPESIGQLSMLEWLSLYENQLSGSIPESIGQLSMLEWLSLYENQLSGSIPESIGQLSMLEGLYLLLNQLSGSIPESIGQLSMLEHLYLSGNQLTGNIPSSLGQLSNLQSLSLYSNQLSGNIPTSLGQLSNLQSLAVWNNSLVGVVSEIHFTKLHNLIWLSLSDNSLTWNVSSGWIPPFIQLKYFGASHCNMGPHFPNWLRTQTGLRELSLSNTSIRDRIPEWFENISSRIDHLDLSYNQIRGNLPRFHGYNSSGNNYGPGRRLRLNSNRFEGTLNSFPWSDVEELDLSDNLLSGNLPYTTINNSGIQIVNLGKNRFTGRVPTYLCELYGLQILVLSHNNFSGIIPKCLGSLIQLLVLDLTNNTITGDIPNSLGSLTQLVSLHLHNNKIEGHLPVSLQNLTSLVTMDLGNNLLMGNIPFWIGKKLSKLKILNLQSNMFMGKIPLELCQIKTLRYLNLANNSISGNVPRCFRNLTGMIKSDINFINDDYEYEENIEACIKGIQLQYTSTIQFLISLDLSSNKISGEVPDVLMKLVALKNLNLSRNLLNGQIPTMIGNLKQMESLDLSTNKLSGRIPPSLASLDFLSYLNLSFNKLSGPIPNGNHLQTLGDPSTIYEGNTELCGPSLPMSCKENNLSYSHASADDGKDGSKGLSWFYAGMVPGFVVGFMGLIGSLHFIRIWRVTYFHMIENVYTFLMVSILVNLARLRRKFF